MIDFLNMRIHFEFLYITIILEYLFLYFNVNQSCLSCCFSHLAVEKVRVQESSHNSHNSHNQQSFPTRTPSSLTSSTWISTLHLLFPQLSQVGSMLFSLFVYFTVYNMVPQSIWLPRSGNIACTWDFRLYEKNPTRDWQIQGR